jgi:hypothetical protein
MSTQDLIDIWIGLKRTSEVDPIRLRTSSRRKTSGPDQSKGK